MIDYDKSDPEPRYDLLIWRPYDTNDLELSCDLLTCERSHPKLSYDLLISICYE